MVETSGNAPVYVGGNDGFGFGGGGGFFMAFLIFALLMGNGGFGLGGGNGNSNAIQNDINRGFDNQNLQAQTRDILSSVTNGTAQTIAASTANATNAINAIKDGNASIIREFGNVETALTALSGKQQECCCNILRGIDGVNFNNAQNTAAIQKTIMEEGQKTRDLITANKIEALQNRVNQLEMQNLTNGMVKYPMSMAYSAGTSPFCSNNGCSCGV